MTLGSVDAPSVRRSAGGFGNQPALDGLRGLAVAGVVVFHFARDVLPGGYLGVDAFFVLSGFLITRLLLRDAVEGRVGLGHFWSRRARRLLPALFVYLAAVIVYVVVVADPAQFEQLRRELLATLFYVANWEQIASGVSYFAPFADPSPLRHTWSLAIEEQFYVVWPLVVAGVAVLVGRRKTRGPVDSARRRDMVVRSVLIVSLIGAVASAVWAHALWDGGAGVSRVYFGTDTRLTAVLVGAALAAALAWRPLTARSSPALTAAGGLALVGMVAFWILDLPDSIRVAGGAALHAEVVAVVAVAAMVKGPVQRVLSPRPLVTLGRLSYGIYLWHVLVQNVVDADLLGRDGVVLFAARITVTLGLAALSFQFVEQPVRSGTGWWQPTDGRRIGLAALGAVTVLIVGGLWATTGAEPSFADRYAADLATRDEPPPIPAADRPGSGADPPPVVAGTEPPRPLEVVVVGDDAVEHLIPSPATVELGSRAVRITGVPGSFCPHTTITSGTATVAAVPACDGWENRSAVRAVVAAADVVVVAVGRIPDLSDQAHDPFGYLTRLDMGAVEAALVELQLAVPPGVPTVLAVPPGDATHPRSARERFASIARRVAEGERQPVVEIDSLASLGQLAALALHQEPEDRQPSQDVTEVMLLGDSVAWSLGYGWYGDPTRGSAPSGEDVVLVWNRGSEFCELVQHQRRAGDEVFEAESRCADWRSVWPEPLERYSPDVVAVHVGVWEVFDRKVDGEWVEVGTPEHDRLITDALSDVVELLATPDRPVVFVNVPPGNREGEFSPEQWTLGGRAAIDHFNELLIEITGRYPDRAAVVDLSSWLCPDECVVDVGGQLVRDDGLHYDPAGALPVSGWLSDQLRAIDLAF